MTLHFEIPEPGETLLYEELNSLCEINGYDFDSVGNKIRGEHLVLLRQGNIVSMSFLLMDNENYKRVY